MNTRTPVGSAFPIAVKPDAPFTRDQLTRHFETKKIGTRLMFAGNLLRQPAYAGHRTCRIIGDMKNTDYVMNNVFWLGTFPGLSEPMLDYIAQTAIDFATAAASNPLKVV